MTDLLAPRPTRRPAAPAVTDGADHRRRLGLAAVAAGVAAPLSVLAVLWAVGLAGWFASDGGTHGTTRSVLRVAADAWLLGHGASLELRDVTVTASPLGLTLLCAWVTYRFGRWAGRAGHEDDLRAVGLAAVTMAGTYAVVALLASLLAAAPGAEPGLGTAFLGGAAVGGLAGGAGLVRGAGLAAALRRSIPVPTLSVGYGAAAVLGLLTAAGAVLLTVALAVQGAAALRVAESLRLDLTGAALSLVLLAGILPNLSLLTVGYLLGPGFAVGTGTVVSPAEVTLGAVPAVPVLAALPADGWAPGWAMGFLAVPVLVGVAAAYLAGRALPTRSYQSGATRGAAAGAAGSLLVAVATSFAGGAIGSGRMTDIGTAFWPILLAGLLSMVPSAAVGGVAATWQARRHDLPEAVHPERPVHVGHLQDEPVAKPLAGPDDLTEPVHLPHVTAEDRLHPHPAPPSGRPADHSDHSDLSDEPTVQVRFPDQR